MADSNVNIRINAQNNASPAIKQVGSDVAKLDKAAGTAAGGLSGLAKVAGAAGLVAFGVQAAQAAVELANLGNQSIAMRASFEQMAGGAENARTILEALTEASRGTVTQYDLMLASNRAMLLGVADSAEEFSQLMQIAAARGRAMGLSTTQAFNDIVTGLGRMSPLILDNLGIVVDQQKAQEAYAVTLGKTSAELTDAEKKQALVNDVIANSADLLHDANSNAKVYAGEGMAQLGTAWSEFRTALGESLGPILEARAKELADFLAGVNDQLNRWQEEDRTVFAPQLANVNVADAKKQLADLQAELLDYTQNASSKILDWADLLGLDDNDPAVLARYQAGLDALIADTVRAQKQLDELLGKQQEVAKAATTQGRAAIAPDLQPTLSSAGDVGLFETERQIQTALQLHKDAVASLQEANRQGNTAAADVANGYLNNLIPAIRGLIGQYNELAEAQGRQRIVGVSYGNAEIIYQTVDALEAEKKAAEDVATALTIIGESDAKLQGLYDTLLDSGNIDGAAASFEAIKGVIADITTEWVSQGKKVEEIQGTLLPKLISELDGVIAAQVEAGQAGVDSGALIGSGFLSAIPGIQAVIGIVNQLTGAVVAAGEGIRAVQRQADLASRVFAGRQPRTGAGDIGLSRNPNILTAGRSAALGRPGPVVGDLVPLGGGGGGGGSSIDNEAQKLANRLTSILNGALKSGINLDEILGRQDAIEEPARRLADIAVRGFESPWVDYIRNTFPEIWKEIESAGDPKQAAASILRDFEDGLRPELLDKNRAKELVKRALLGEQNTAALAAEIAAELAGELGVSLEQAQQAAAGVLGTGSTGTGDGTGLDGGVAATAFTDSFVGAMAGFLTRYQSTGESAGAAFQVGFLATTAAMPAAILQNLAGLLLPMLAAALAGQNSRTGAS